MMGQNMQKKWFDIVSNHATNQSLEQLENCIERFLLIEDNISLDIKEWMSEGRNLGTCPSKTWYSLSAI
jgi:hypothetical protein